MKKRWNIIFSILIVLIFIGSIIASELNNNQLTGYALMDKIKSLISAKTYSFSNPPKMLTPCSDTDNGRNLETKGTATGTWILDGSVRTQTDSCSPNGKLAEYYCYTHPTSKNSFMYIYYYNCPEGSVCIDGACKSEEVQEDWRDYFSFHYYVLNPNQDLDYVSAGLLQYTPSTLESNIAYWKSINPEIQLEKYKASTIHTATCKDSTNIEACTAEKLSETCVDGTCLSAVMFEEVGASSYEIMANSLKIVPNFGEGLVFSVYTVGLPTPPHEIYEAFAMSHIKYVLPEAYDTSAKQRESKTYFRITTYFNNAISAGIADKTLVVLDLKNSITTPQEFKRQLHYIRYYFPQMKGLDFYHSEWHESIANKLNDYLRIFYDSPVLRAEVSQDNKLNIKNIGSHASNPTTAKVQCGTGESIISLPALNIGEEKVLTIGSGCSVQSRLDTQPTILAKPLLWSEEPAKDRPNAESAWPGLIASSEKTFLFNTESEFETSEQNYYETTYFPLDNQCNKDWKLEYDLFTGSKFQKYGHLNLGLIDDEQSNFLKVELMQGQYDDAHYLQVYTVENADQSVGLQVNTHEYIPIKINSSSKYKVRVYYKNGEYFRVRLLDSNSAILWDTGEIPNSGDFNFDKILFSVRDRDGTAYIYWDGGDLNNLLSSGSICFESVDQSNKLTGCVDNIKFQCSS